ncbi:BTAD domain-containing putative transcriptional regulator [Streptacidiphilus sp. EB103A]|uniref:BTAD domain-containing putative transcriptional regulator n=1 Tax=Streptacidiphilus sp. EB103A TaxID=3156275 RepID=UPI003517C5BC
MQLRTFGSTEDVVRRGPHPLRTQTPAWDAEGTPVPLDPLIRARHGSGQQAEALSAFADAREALADALADALGADPGPELAAAHLAVLRGPTNHVSRGTGIHVSTMIGACMLAVGAVAALHALREVPAVMEDPDSVGRAPAGGAAHRHSTIGAERRWGGDSHPRHSPPPDRHRPGRHPAAQ